MAPPGAERFKAFVAPAPALEEASLDTLCNSHIQGSCKNVSCDPRSHRICRVRGLSHRQVTPLPAKKNFLSLAARADNLKFEDDGPGELSKWGARHDNDHLDITSMDILPTTDEVLSTRMPYMPPKSPDDSHQYGEGVRRYVDIQFRHLRYESTAAISEACLAGLRLVTSQKLNVEQWRQETASGARYSVFKNVNVEGVLFHDHDGAMFQLSYDCPSSYQGRQKMTKAPFFDEGMLCALLAVHQDTFEVNIIFLKTILRQSTEAMRSKTQSHSRASLQVVLADTDQHDKATQLVFYQREQLKSCLFLLDIPGILAASFMSHLKVLRDLFLSEEFAFKNYITARDPTAIIRSTDGVVFPAPTGIATDGEFDLGKLKKEDDGRDLKLATAPLSRFTDFDTILTDIKNRSTLDDGQSIALLESLNREMAFTQGPPGTGKTFLGVALVETLLNSCKSIRKPSPLIVVCQTNHALDDFIEELIKRNVTQITRLGSGSNARWIEPYLLRHQRNKSSRTMKEVAKAGHVKHQVEGLYTQAISYGEALSAKHTVPWLLIESFLMNAHPKVHGHFSTLESSSKDTAARDVRAARMWKGFAFMYWQEGGDIRDAQGFVNAFDSMLGECQICADLLQSEIAVLRDEVAKNFQSGMEIVSTDQSCMSLWSMDQASRQKLAQQWLSETSPLAICEAFGELHRRFIAARDRLKVVFNEEDAKTIMEQRIQVIGMTSTASAMMRDLVKKVRPEIAIFEEASELLEIHTTVSLVPSIKYCIQIGDPLQLRPQLEQMQLKTEHSPLYRLDESLFERFMVAGMPYSQLNTQRRAHPDIAQLLRVGDYPYVIDHPNTVNRPLVAGLASRLWWFDHQQPEDCVDPHSPLSKSASNQYEAQFVAALVGYFVTKQGYKFREITVLVPYKGQLVLLQKELSQICKVSLTEKDREYMIDASLIEDKEYVDGTSFSLSLSDMLRIATIDNYQGEQARIIILSTVRSNFKNSMGFLANHNRANVAISRAEDGFYVIGNASLIRKDVHWAKIISLFEIKGAIGNTFITRCHRHPQTSRSISKPSEFENATCNEPCNMQLPCGHTCDKPCHLLEMHNDGRLPCLHPCSRLYECGHSCEKLCHQQCGKCNSTIDKALLPCGHERPVKCGEPQPSSECDAIVSSMHLDCGHVRSILCSDPKDSDLYLCTQSCEAELSCGHICGLRCSECSISQEHTQICENSCGRSLSCGHVCRSVCHRGACPPCKEPCKLFCLHRRCPRLCHEQCRLCIEFRARDTCPHSSEPEPPTLCCLPRTSLPCSKVCTKVLSCGVHTCSGTCGEACPVECEECLSGLWPSKDTITLPCKHTFPRNDLDERFGLEKIYEFDENKHILRVAITKLPSPSELVCPRCAASTRGSRRYELANSLPNLSEIIERLVGICAQKLSSAFKQVTNGEQALFIQLKEFFTALRTGPMSVTANRYAIDRRLARIIDAQQATRQQKDLVVQIEQSIYNACKNLRSHLFHTPNLQFSLRLDLLYFWTKLAMVEFAHFIASRLAVIPERDLPKRLMIVGCSANAVQHAASECEAIHEKVAECTEKSLKRLETEFRMIQICFWTILQANDATMKSNLDVSKTMVQTWNLIHRYPTTAGLYLQGFGLLRVCLQRRHIAPRFWDLGNARTSAMWHAWNSHRSGNLLLCEHNHFYPPKLFEDGCPECGKEKELDIQVERMSCVEREFRPPAESTARIEGEGIVDANLHAMTMEEFCGEAYEACLRSWTHPFNR